MRMLLAALAVVFAMPVAAQQCGARDDVSALLRGQYGETVQITGLDMAGTVMTFWANPATGTWTVTATNAHGIMCLVAAGDNLTEVYEHSGVDG